MACVVAITLSPIAFVLCAADRSVLNAKEYCRPGETGKPHPGPYSGLPLEAPRAILNQMLNYITPIDRVLQALADPTRRIMIERLSRGAASVSELAEPLDMSMPAVMQHLQILETSGLVKSEKTGRVRTCRMEAAALAPLERWIGERRAMWEQNFDRLGDYLAATAPSRKKRKRQT
jgi:DNA-binding transcriptional ArsR family regulator